MFMNVDRLEFDLKKALAAGGQSAGITGFKAQSLEDRWILSRFNRATEDVNRSLQNYRFDEAATRIYDFFWGEFCDWYVELIKPRLDVERGADAKHACTNLVVLFEAALRLLHPLMPFITDEIWHALFDGAPPLKSAALAQYPQVDSNQIDLAAETHMAILQDLIVNVRNLRAELKVEPKMKTPVQVFAGESEIRALFENNRTAIERLGNAEPVELVAASLGKVPGSRQTSRYDVHVVYEKKIDVAAERQALAKEIEKMERELANGQRQLSNEQFLAKAPAKVVEGLRTRSGELTNLLEKAKSKLNELK
jgi:valyl-tRNA synthetase